MKFITMLRGYRFYGIYCLLIAVPLRGDCLTLRALFDALFPSSAYKNLVVYTIRLRTMMETVEKQSNSEEKNHLRQLVSGSMTQFERYANAVIHELRVCRSQDIEYLLILLDRVALQARESFRDAAPLDRLYVERVAAIQETIDRLL